MKNYSLLTFLLLSFFGSALAQSPRAYDHVFLVVLENENADNALQQPFLKSLADKGVYLSNYYAIGHPSQPNYLAMIAGDTFGVSDDGEITINNSHLGDLLEKKGLNWKVYAEGYPGNCDLRSEIGGYARKHVPFISFENVQNNPKRCARVADARELDRDLAAGNLPNFSMFIPDQSNDGHDTDVAYADKYMAKKFGPLLSDPKFTSRTLFIVVFDEGGWFSSNQVYAVLLGEQVAKAKVLSSRLTHYDLLRTIEDLFDLGTLGRNDSHATSILSVKR